MSTSVVEMIVSGLGEAEDDPDGPRLVGGPQLHQPQVHYPTRRYDVTSALGTWSAAYRKRYRTTLRIVTRQL